MTFALLWPYIVLPLGLWLLAKSADAFIEGAEATAAHLALPPVLIGIVLLGMGTSAPEIVVSFIASMQGAAGLAVGNVVGSNIANIGLVLALIALLYPVTVPRDVIRGEGVWLSAATIGVLGLLALDGHLGRLDAIFMLAMLGLVLYAMVRKYQKSHTKPDEHTTPEMPLPRALAWLIAGLVVLIANSHLLVAAASTIAVQWGVSDTLVGLTIVAVGTSLPELAASINAAQKGKTELVIGNVVGSNLFNLLIVLPIPGLIAGFAVPDTWWRWDLAMMCALTLGLVAYAYQGRTIHRAVALVALSVYALYLGRAVMVAI